MERATTDELPQSCLLTEDRERHGEHERDGGRAEARLDEQGGGQSRRPRITSVTSSRSIHVRMIPVHLATLSYDHTESEQIFTYSRG